MTNKATAPADTTNVAGDAVDQTTAPAAPAAAAPVIPTKMDKAKILFAGLNDGTIALAEGKSARATFIAQAQEAEIGMTKNGAATYWQNLVSKAKGGKLYPHTATKKTAAATPADAAPAADKVDESLQAQEHAEEQVADGVKDENDVSHLAE